MIKTVYVHQRLRPLRMVFLVRPDDREALRRVFVVNTCIWGGQFNGIIPMFGETPHWWVERSQQRPTPQEIIKGYLSAFDPDLVINTLSGHVVHADVDDTRLVDIEEVLSAQPDQPVGLGLSVLEVYRALYKREFRFVPRHRIDVFCPRPKQDRFSLFIAACFGAFPSDEVLAVFRHSYQKMLNASDSLIDATNLFQLLTENAHAPLSIGSHGLRVLRKGFPMWPVLFFMDGTKPLDLIDFWNLRAMGLSILPVPKQWSDQLLEQCIEFVRAHNIPLPSNPRLGQLTTLMKSRSIEYEEFRAFAGRIKAQGLSVQDWYPRIWDECARTFDGVQRCDVYAEEEEFECGIRDGWISFRSLSPSFLDGIRTSPKPGWATVVRISDYSPGSELAQVLPPGLANLERLLKSYEVTPIATNSEGLVILENHQGWRHRWKLPDGFSVFKSWLQSRGLEAQLSSAGRIAMQLIRCLGGAAGVSAIRNIEVLKFFERAAGGPRRRVLGRQELWGVLLKANHGDRNRAERHLRSLIKKRALRVGLMLPCPECARKNWYRLQEISERLRCEWCLQEFSFPLEDPPPKTAWRYRTQGPFSVGDYAQGSYTVALALRFLTALAHADATWVPGLTIQGDKIDPPMEVDFALWWKRSELDRGEPILLFGECKSFKSFEEKDFERAERLASLFRGAALVFATLRPELNPDEKERITGLARAGREQLRTGKWRNPVLVLTSHELTAALGPPHCWLEAGGRFAAVARNYRGYGEFTQLCDATQQLDLGMESYAQWQLAQLKRLQRRQAPGGAGPDKD